MLHVLSRLAKGKLLIGVAQKTTLIKMLLSEPEVSGLGMVGSKNTENWIS